MNKLSSRGGGAVQRPFAETSETPLGLAAGSARGFGGFGLIADRIRSPAFF